MYLRTKQHKWSIPSNRNPMVGSFGSCTHDYKSEVRSTILSIESNNIVKENNKSFHPMTAFTKQIIKNQNIFQLYYQHMPHFCLMTFFWQMIQSPHRIWFFPLSPSPSHVVHTLSPSPFLSPKDHHFLAILGHSPPPPQKKNLTIFNTLEC